MRRPCAVFANAAVADDAAAARESHGSIAWLAAGFAALIAVAVSVHLVWATIVAPIDAAANVMGQVAGMVTPAADDDTPASAADALREAQSKLVRDQRGSELGTENAGPATDDRANLARALDDFEASRQTR